MDEEKLTSVCTDTKQIRDQLKAIAEEARTSRSERKTAELSYEYIEFISTHMSALQGMLVIENKLLNEARQRRQEDHDILYEAVRSAYHAGYITGVQTGYEDGWRAHEVVQTVVETR